MNIKDKIRDFFYNLKYFFRNLKDILTFKRIIIFIAVTVAVLGGFRLMKLLNRPKAVDSRLYGKKEITVGVVTGTKLSHADENGISGFEKDLMEKMLSDLFPGSSLRFIEIESTEASYDLKIKKIDLAIGMFTSGPIKTQGLSLSSGYYTDNVYAYVTKGSSTDDLFSLTNKRVRLLSSDITKSSVNNMFKKLGINVDLHLCSSVEDGLESIRSGDCSAFVAPGMMVPDDLGLRNIEEPVGQISYRIIMWKEKDPTLDVINQELGSLKTNGYIDELCEKYGLMNDQ